MLSEVLSAHNQGTRVSHAISDGSLYKTSDDVIT
ncbi:unnamed protein product [Ectocarpus sp. CCAP 1310/34]|nr:unnamed protein product [Ectocarpus sp. CCAP 1310/34]